MKDNSLLRCLCIVGFCGAAYFSPIQNSNAVVPAIVVPNSATNTEGNGANAFPFDFSSTGRINSIRYQQLYDASQFSGLGSGGFITQIIFRPDAALGGIFSTTLPQLQINLSTTSVQDDGLSSLFADNVGSDDTIVFNGPLPLSSQFTGGTPKDFDIVINLTTPFFYNPSSGNLLLDVRDSGTSLTAFFDSTVQPHDGVSRVTTNSRNGVTQTTADFKDTQGLITGFTIGSGVLTLTSSASELGSFDVALPGIECRSAGAGQRYAIVFAFNNNIVSVGPATTNCGQVSSVVIDSTDPRRVIVNLRRVTCDGSDLAIGLTGINDDQGNTLPTASTSMTLLFGDVTGDGTVDDADFQEVRSHKGETTDETNFRNDVNVDGQINNLDGRLVKSAETTLP